MVLTGGTEALRKAISAVSAVTRKQWQPLQVRQCATVSKTHRQGCTVRDMMHKIRAEPLDTGPGLQVLRLVRLARGHHTYHSPWGSGEGTVTHPPLNPPPPPGC